jgi:hypothetical protein
MSQVRLRAGQALIESCLAMMLICLIFAGLFQVSQILAAREVLYHAAARGTRAKTVGFNKWMVEKCVRVAAIPNAGKMTEPGFVNDNPALRQMVQDMRPGDLWTSTLRSHPNSGQYTIEEARIPFYMASVNRARSEYLLDYADWNTVHFSTPGLTQDDTIHMTVSQDYPLKSILHRTFYADDTVTLEGESYLENHYPLYIDDKYW